MYYTVKQYRGSSFEIVAEYTVPRYGADASERFKTDTDAFLFCADRLAYVPTGDVFRIFDDNGNWVGSYINGKEVYPSH